MRLLMAFSRTTHARQFSCRTSLLCGLACIAICGLNAEDEYERVRPKEPERDREPAALPDIEAEVPGDETELVKALVAVVFLASDDKVDPDPKDAAGIQTARVPLLDTPSFRERLGVFLGKPVSMKSLNRMIRAAILYHREQDRPLVDVLAPEQDITNGIVQLIVIEGQVGAVKVEGNRWFSEKLLRGKIRTKPGDKVYASRLLRELESLNRNPFRDVNVLFSPGIEKGQTDVIFQARDRFPVRFYTGYEDTGSAATGRDRVLGGFNWGNAFFQDHELGYQYTTDITGERYRAHSGYYRVPLPLEGHQLTAFGSHSASGAPLNTDFSIEGITWQIGLRYQARLQDLGAYRHSATAGFDFKRANSDLAFGGESVFRSVTDVAAWSLDYSGSASDAHGSSSFSATGFWSPGGLTENQRPRHYRSARAFSDAEFAYATLSFERTWNLPRKVTLWTRATGQLANENLLGSEQLGFGGYNTIRGYNEREYNADQGLIANAELRSPRFNLGKIANKDDFASTLQVYAFYDYGLARNHRLLPGEVTPDFQSTGLGARYQMGSHIQIRFDYGWRLEKGFEKNDGGRIHLGVVVSY